MFANRKVCLCQRHQNFALKIRALRNLGMKVNQNPDRFIEDVPVADIKARLELLNNANLVKFEVWKKCDQVYNERIVQRVRLTKTETIRDTFKKEFVHEMEEFRDHAARVRAQYSAVKELKERMLSRWTSRRTSSATTVRRSRCIL